MFYIYIYSLKLPVWSTNHPTKKKRFGAQHPYKR